MRGTLAIGSLRTCAQSLMPVAIAALRQRYPDLSFRLRIGMSEELMREVAAGQLDTALSQITSLSRSRCAGPRC